MLSEKELIRLAKTNPRVFGELYDAHYPRVFGYIYRITGDHALAGDIAAETFLKAFVRIGTFHWRGISISSWFFRIAVNELNQYFRKKNYSPERLSDLQGLDDANGLDGVDWPNRHALRHESNEITRRIDEQQEFEHIRRVLGTLPAKYRQVIALRFFEELSIRDISEILGKKEGTVKSLLSRGLAKLKTKLTATYPAF
ncbi:MAG TPA: RNA polymerase sigma factor [Puia sp.]|nr:RNA polymerase sigma factor [Puia sp.]